MSNLRRLLKTVSHTTQHTHAPGAFTAECVRETRAFRSNGLEWQCVYVCLLFKAFKVCARVKGISMRLQNKAELVQKKNATPQNGSKLISKSDDAKYNAKEKEQPIATNVCRTTHSRIFRASCRLFALHTQIDMVWRVATLKTYSPTGPHIMYMFCGERIYISIGGTHILANAQHFVLSAKVSLRRR